MFLEYDWGGVDEMDRCLPAVSVVQCSPPRTLNLNVFLTRSFSQTLVVFTFSPADRAIVPTTFVHQRAKTEKTVHILNEQVTQSYRCLVCERPAHGESEYV